MRTILVPLFGMNELSLNAVNFAVHYAERSSAIPVFILFRKDLSGNIPDNSDSQSGCVELVIKELIHDYLVQEEAEDDRFFNLQEYELEISKWVKKHDISEIVMSAPDNSNHLYPVFLEHVESLKQTTNCRIITVKGLTERCK
ncbi:MAG: hypothetical protein ABR533_11925 [Desulfonatronovibrio sp.]